MWDLTTLFRRYSRELQGYLRRRGAAADVAADLSQDTFLRLAQLVSNDAGRDLPRNERAYLYRIAANLQIDAQRRARPFTSEVDMRAIVDPAPRPDEVLISKEEQRLLARALSEVPEGARQVFDLRLQGYTFAQISARLGIPLQTAYSRLSAVLMHLQMRLQQADKPDPARRK